MTILDLKEYMFNLGFENYALKSTIFWFYLNVVFTFTKGEKTMKKLLILLSIIAVSTMAFFFGSSQNKNTLKNLQTENEIVVKEDLSILYMGEKENLPNSLENKEIIEIDVCDDTENTLCVFVK